MSGGIKEKIYDTNVLIDLFKTSKIKEFDYIITSIFNVIEFPPILKYASKLIIIYPTKDDYTLALKMMVKLRELGKPVGIIDLMIASIAVQRNMIVVSNDKDIEVIKEIEPRLEVTTFHN
ncbi:type II toxin-antitoxin system VapC family toxin [Stygiolobus sp. CP850M]|uniref:type II toxin-antitoxin system VapC family toxin n=1 Tax=Stygiolobus sp. CP850M TaxID=3133134 RepID=UPI00307E848E